MIKDLISNIADKNYNEANDLFEQIVSDISDIKLNEMKKIIQAENIDEEYELDEAARFKIVKARFRGGKLQRRKKVSNVSGFTYRGGKLTRMSPAERRKRKMGQRRGVIKRKAKLRQAAMKRQRTMRRRKAMGL